MCAGILATGGAGYGQLQVLKSNGVSGNSACDAISTNSGPYTKYFCYGSVDASAISHVDKAANATVGGGWYGYAYCAGTNGMSTYCCCHSNFDNNK